MIIFFPLSTQKVVHVIDNDTLNVGTRSEINIRFRNTYLISLKKNGTD